jgi:redox-sensing transcriptional repressor
MTDNLSPALVRRLPQYFRALIKFYGSGKERISSEELAREIGLVPSQVRTDIKALGCTGQRSYGYGIPTLYKKIADILQLSDKYSAVIVGSCNVVRAIAQTEIFTKRGIKLTAVFIENRCDIPSEFSEKALAFDGFCEYCLANQPNIIILGGDGENAKTAFKCTENAALKTGYSPEIWNFTSEDFVSDTLTVKNIHLSDYLMLLCYEIGKNGTGQK